MKDETLDELSYKLMEAIYNGDQYWSLQHAAKIRRLVLSQQLQALRELDGKDLDPTVTAAILDELTKLAGILGGETKGGE